jgi:hypothetical protein
MPARAKIDLNELHDLLGKGKRLTWLANHFNVSVAAIHQARRKLKKGVVNAALVRSHQIVGKQMHAIDRIQRIEDGLDDDMERLLDLFQQAVSVNEKATMIKLRGDILDRHRKLLLTKLEYLRGMTDLQVVPEFVNQLLNVIEEVEHGSRQKILRRLEQVIGPSITIITGPQAEVSRTFQAEGEPASPGGCPAGADGGGSDDDVHGDSSGCDGE